VAVTQEEYKLTLLASSSFTLSHHPVIPGFAPWGDFKGPVQSRRRYSVYHQLIKVEAITGVLCEGVVQKNSVRIGRTYDGRGEYLIWGSIPKDAITHLDIKEEELDIDGLTDNMDDLDIDRLMDNIDDLDVTSASLVN
jgi:hypothetical protein